MWSSIIGQRDKELEIEKKINKLSYFKAKNLKEFLDIQLKQNKLYLRLNEIRTLKGRY